MIGWQFAHPWILVVGLVGLLLGVWLRYRYPRDIASGSGSVDRTGSSLLRITDLFLYIAIVCATLAAAHPRFGTRQVEENRKGIAIADILDTSGSMEAIDFGARGTTLSRLKGAVSVMRRFIRNRHQDQQCLIVFGEKVFTLAPLTGDIDLLLGYLDEVQPGMAGKQTAIGDALAIAVRRLKDSPLTSRIAILVTDGKSNAGSISPEEATMLAVDNGIKVYTIGIGHNGTAPFRTQGLFGDTVQMFPVEIDEAALRKIASTTGGLYFNADNISEMKTIFVRIDKLEKSTFKAHVTVHYSNHYMPFLTVALVSLLLFLGIGGLFGRYPL